MSFQVILNGVTLSNEPKGLDSDTSIQIVRDQDIQGLFTTLISDLVFWGDGYDVIQSALVSVGLCGSIPIEINELNCDVSPIAFEGLIYLSDVEIDEFKCTASVSAEDNSLASLVMRLKDTKVRVNNGLTVDGSALASIGTSIFVGGTIGTITAFAYKDLYQHVLNYITNNELLVTSTNAFSTEFQEYVVEYTFSSGGLSGILRYRYTDYLGIPNDLITTVPGALTDDQLAEEFAQLLNGNSEFETFPRGLSQYRAIRIGNVVRVRFLQPPTGEIITVPLTSSVSGSVVSAGSYGLENVYIMPGSAFKDDGQDFLISFTDLVSIGSYFNLSFEFGLNGMQQEIEIDQEKYFFETGPLVTITNAKLIQKQVSPLSFASLEYAQQNEDEKLLMFKRRSYVSQSCNTTKISISNAVNSIGDILPSSPNEATDDRIYLFEATSIGNVIQYQTSYLSSGVITDGPIFYGGILANHIVAKQYVNRAPEGMEFEGETILNTETVKIAKTITFEAPISRSDFNLIFNNKRKPISINGRNGWISNVNYNIKTGMTSFELLTE